MGCTASEHQSENLALRSCRCAEHALVEGGETPARNGLLGVALDSSEPALSSVKSPLDDYEPPVESQMHSLWDSSKKSLEASMLSQANVQQIASSAGAGVIEDSNGAALSGQAADSDFVEHCQTVQGTTKEAVDSDFVKNCQRAQACEDLDISSATTADTLRDVEYPNDKGLCRETLSSPLSRPCLADRRRCPLSVETRTSFDDDPDSPSTAKTMDSAVTDDSTSPEIVRRKSAKRFTLSGNAASRVSTSMQIVVENHKPIVDVYTMRKELGKGSSGSVREGVLKASGDRRAIKKVSKVELKEREGALNEINIMKMVDHLNVIKLFETFEDDSFIYMVMPLCAHGHLTSRILEGGHMNESEAKPCMRQIVAAMHYLHNNNIAHRDLKPDNVLCHILNPLNLKLSDFGLSRTIKPKKMMTSAVGSPTFMAPEVFLKKYNLRCDVWSCGISLYFLLCGYIPFDGDDFETVKAVVLGKSVKYNTKEWADTKKETLDFLNGMLKKNPKQRYSADDVFLHGWLQEEQASFAVKDPRKVFHDLHTFRQTNKLKRSSLVVIASMLKTDDSVQYHSDFVALDPNNDGTVSLDEIQTKLKPKEMTDEEVAIMFEDPNSEEDGFKPFSYTEFLAATMDKKRLVTEKLCKAAFATFDKDSDGSISMAELAGGVLGHLSMEELAATYAAIDTNGDGHLSFEEFKAILLA